MSVARATCFASSMRRVEALGVVGIAHVSLRASSNDGGSKGGTMRYKGGSGSMGVARTELNMRLKLEKTSDPTLNMARRAMFRAWGRASSALNQKC